MSTPNKTSRFILACAGILLGAFSGCDNGRQAEVPPQSANAGRRAFAHVRVEVSKTTVQPPAPAAVVNGEPITFDAVNQQTERLRGANDPRAARRELVLHRMIDEILIRQWLDQQPRDRDLPTPDVELRLGSPEDLERHLQDAQVSSAQLEGSLRQEARLEAALGPFEITDLQLHALYADLLNRPAVETKLALSSVTLPLGTTEEQARNLCQNADSLETFRKLPGSHVEMGEVHETALSSTLANSLGTKANDCAANIETPSGRQLYWVAERLVNPTSDFVEMEPVLRERARAIALEAERAKLLSRLREDAQIRLNVQPTDSSR